MQWLKSLLGWLVNPLGWLPPAQRRRVIYWTVHILVIVLIVVGLGILNLQGGLDRVLRTRVLGLQRVWLPVLFLLGYALFWLIRWLYWLLGPDGVVGEFDDIETTWKTVCGQLEEAGISISSKPVFLVLGEPAGSLEDFFAASRLPFQLRHAPGTPDAPLNVYANREAIYVTSEGCSLLSVHIDRLRQSTAPPPAVTEEYSPLHEFLETGELANPPQLPANTGLEPMPSPTGQPAVLLLGEPEPAPGEPVEQQRASLLTDGEKVELQTRRLRHLCKVIQRDRRPFCSLNGILLLVPMMATDSLEDTSETAAIMRHDLQVVREALQLDCPRVVVLCDGETLPGFSDLLQNFPQDGKGPQWVLGQHFPLIPDVPPDQLLSQIESGVRWVGDTMLPLVIGQLWRREGEEGVSDRTLAAETNIRLYEFLHECRHRLQLLGRLASRGVYLEGVPLFLAGAYLAGTGADAEREQGFLGGVFRRTIEHQNNVRWTQDALADDAAYRRYTFVGYLLLIVFVLTVALILIAWW